MSSMKTVVCHRCGESNVGTAMVRWRRRSNVDMEREYSLCQKCDTVMMHKLSEKINEEAASASS